jgi:hypothetical protein
MRRFACLNVLPDALWLLKPQLRLQLRRLDGCLVPNDQPKGILTDESKKTLKVFLPESYLRLKETLQKSNLPV